MADLREHDFIRTVTPEACDYSGLRHQFSHWLERQGVAPPIVADWRLVLSELAANACEAAPPGGPVTVDAVHRDGRVELRVTNPTVGPTTLQPARTFDADASRGRGLLIVDTITDGVEYDVGPDAISVRCWIATPTSRS